MELENLSLNLIQSQYKLRSSKYHKNSKGVLILIGGIELTNKNKSVKKLSELMDPRYLKVKAELPQKINKNKLIWQPYIHEIPRRGEIVTFYGNWYTDLLASTFFDDSKNTINNFNYFLEKINEFENYLRNHNIDIIKVWFNISWEKLNNKLTNINLSKSTQRIPNFAWDNFPIEKWRNKKIFSKIQAYEKTLIEDWYIIDSKNNKDRNLEFANIILSHLQSPPLVIDSKLHYEMAEIPSSLIQIKNSQIDQIQYKKTIKALERKVAEALRFSSKNIILAFEGMDAAGKGSSIKRIIKYLNPFEYTIHSISAPEDHEKLRPYLWRFWTKHTTNGAINIFDRTWYGRVLVERVEHLITDTEWQNAYQEINIYEKQLVDTNTIVIKFWLAISKDEQLIRFEKRQNTPQKNFKITEDDWRNREKWDAYLQAASDMFKYTNTRYAPWHIISNDNKYAARIEILQTILISLQHHHTE